MEVCTSGNATQHFPLDLASCRSHPCGFWTRFHRLIAAGVNPVGSANAFHLKPLLHCEGGLFVVDGSPDGCPPACAGPEVPNNAFDELGEMERICEAGNWMDALLSAQAYAQSDFCQQRSERLLDASLTKFGADLVITSSDLRLPDQAHHPSPGRLVTFKQPGARIDGAARCWKSPKSPEDSPKPHWHQAVRFGRQCCPAPDLQAGSASAVVKQQPASPISTNTGAWHTFIT